MLAREAFIGSISTLFFGDSNDISLNTCVYFAAAAQRAPLPQRASQYYIIYNHPREAKPGN